MITIFVTIILIYATSSAAFALALNAQRKKNQLELELQTDSLKRKREQFERARRVFMGDRTIEKTNTNRNTDRAQTTANENELSRSIDDLNDSIAFLSKRISDMSKRIDDTNETLNRNTVEQNNTSPYPTDKENQISYENAKQQFFERTQDLAMELSNVQVSLERLRETDENVKRLQNDMDKPIRRKRDSDRDKYLRSFQKHWSDSQNVTYCSLSIGWHPDYSLEPY